MSEKLQKRSGKAIIIHPPTMRMLILQLEAIERRKRSKPGEEFDEWHIPGGSLENADGGSTQKAAEREALEETELIIRVVKKLGEAKWSAYYDGELADFHADFYLSVVGEDELELPKVKLSTESSGSAWIARSEFEDFLPRGLTPEAVEFGIKGFNELEASK